MKRHELFSFGLLVLICFCAGLGQPSFARAESLEFKWSGDVRVRGQSEALEGEASRISEKLRLRLGVRMQVDPDLFAEVRLASARSNRSTNQTLGDNKEPGEPRRFIGLDVGYGEWKPIPEVKFDLGRFPQVHFRPGGSQVLLDDDIALEGAAASVDVPLWEDWKVFGSAGSTWIRENYDTYYSEKQTDNMLNWGQLGLQWKSGIFAARVGGGFFNYVSVQGRPFSELVTGGTSQGNSETVDGNVKNAFLPREIFVDGTVKWLGSEWGAFAERVINPETEDPNDALWVGLSFAKKPIDLQIAYGDVQSDSVVGLFTNSDFGNGSTDVRGFQAAVRWTFMTGTSLRLTQFVNRIQASTNDLAYNRTHLDLLASF